MNDKNNFDGVELIRFLEEGKMRSHPLIGQRVDRALRTGNFQPLLEFLINHPNFVAFAERNIQQEKTHLLTNPFLYPDRDDAREFLSGPLKLGYVNQFDDMFGVSPQVMVLPIQVLGRVGSGKSRLIKYLLIQMLLQNKNYNILVVDLKREYRHLLPYAKNLKILSPDRILVNPFQVPPDIPVKDYVYFISKVLISENWLGGTSLTIIVKSLDHLYKQRGIYDGNSKNYPTMRDLYNYISFQLEDKRSFKYRDILLNLQARLYPYIMSDLFNCRIGIPFGVWRNEHVVIEADTGFTDNMYAFTVSYLAGLRYMYNKQKDIRGNLSTLFCIDEARILFNANRDTTIFGESYIQEIITKTREFGIGFIVASQESTSYPQILRSLSFLKVAFPLNDAKDLEFIQNSFGLLNNEQKDYLFKLPPFGRAVVRYGGYESPFLLQVPHINPKKIVTDEEVEQRMAGFYSELDAQIKKSPVQKSLEIKGGMPSNAAALLHFLGKNPFAKINQMKGAPGFSSPAEVTKALSWLEDNGYVTKESYRVAKKGRKATFAVLSQKAFDYLGLKGTTGKGGFEHKLYQNIICKKLISDGFGAKIEGRVKGSDKLIDILAWSDTEGAIAYEISIHLENLASNIRKNFESRVSKVIIVTTDTNSQRKAREAVNADASLNQYRDRIDFSIISDFFP